jgi:ferredoxin
MEKPYIYIKAKQLIRLGECEEICPTRIVNSVALAQE